MSLEDISNIYSNLLFILHKDLEKIHEAKTLDEFEKRVNTLQHKINLVKNKIIKTKEIIIKNS